ncbi:MAG: BamA/TamA family outer membrane protein [Lentisphaerae bacterium]|jgi:hemolysin activation/secretion protein|nr:BamA/TamA family outer membrane protein [Lentisphaerota bacterium]MBT5604843.1 BamA/TamA family outer membrane protein [Lentisphaerota bacterium]MBT7056106.1 BamA/TamA family outer membrane protein [Lentisphaerota bacterium]MBT7847367.1 BamA/TamA family outer membrane protein [Lentisphaerota bacterium]
MRYFPSPTSPVRPRYGAWLVAVSLLLLAGTSPLVRAALPVPGAPAGTSIRVVAHNGASLTGAVRELFIGSVVMQAPFADRMVIQYDHIVAWHLEETRFYRFQGSGTQLGRLQCVNDRLEVATARGTVDITHDAILGQWHPAELQGLTVSVTAKNGSVIQGRFVHFDAHTVMLEAPFRGVMTLPNQEVHRWEATPEQLYVLANGERVRGGLRYERGNAWVVSSEGATNVTRNPVVLTWGGSEQDLNHMLPHEQGFRRAASALPAERTRRGSRRGGVLSGFGRAIRRLPLPLGCPGTDEPQFQVDAPAGLPSQQARPAPRPLQQVEQQRPTMAQVHPLVRKSFLPTPDVHQTMVAPPESPSPLVVTVPPERSARRWVAPAGLPPQQARPAPRPLQQVERQRPTMAQVHPLVRKSFSPTPDVHQTMVARPGSPSPLVVTVPPERSARRWVAPAPRTLREPTVEVREIAIIGNDSIPASELQPLLAGCAGRAMTLTELKAAADAVTAEYWRRGMGLAKAYVPAQEIDHGRVKMEVLEGKPGIVTVEGNHVVSKEFVRKHIEVAMADGPVTNRELERGLLILNEEFPGLHVQSVLSRGQERGKVDIEAKVVEDKQWRGFLGYNNFGSDSVSRHRFQIGADANSLVRYGDLLSVLGSFGEEPDELANGAVSYRLPVNYRGTQVGLRFAAGAYEVSQEFADLGLEGDSVSGGLFVTHPFIKRPDLRVSGEMGLHSADSSYEILGATTSSDRIRTAYATLRASASQGCGETSAIVNVTQGLGRFAGGMPKDSDYASRLGAGNNFTQLTLSLARRQLLSRYAGLLARVEGQFATDPLVASQEWQIGGADSVRGYAPSEATGDQGFFASLELQITPFPDRPYSIVAFVDHGYTRRHETFVAEPDDMELTGAGVGFRLAHSHRLVSASLRLDLGWPIGAEDSSLDEEPSLYLSTELRF